MIPVSYHTLGFTAIMIMIAILVIAEIVKGMRERIAKRKVNKPIGH